MEIIIWGKHVIHSFIVNLYKAYSYKLLILFKDVLDNSRNYSSVFRFRNVLRDTLW
jgi:IS5 family transposase